MDNKKQKADQLRNLIDQLNKTIEEAKDIGLTVIIDNNYSSVMKNIIEIKIEERINY